MTDLIHQTGAHAGTTDARMPPPGITAMIPCYNEVDCVERAYQEIQAEVGKYDDVELLFIDDGSTDGTLDAIKGFAAVDPRVKYISFARNFGLEAAFSAGFKYASKAWTVQFDADLQSPPHEMHRLVAKAMEGYDVVFAVRENRRDPWYRKLGTWAHQTIARRWLGIELPQGASVFRIVRTSVARKVVDSRLSTPYFIATAPLIGARYTTLPTEHHPRVDGVGKWNLRKLFPHAIELFVGFSFRPLAWLIGLTAAAVAGGGVISAMALAGQLSQLAVGLAALVTSLVTLMLLAMVARYLVRVMRVQAIGVPRYQIREANIPIRADEALYGHETPYVVAEVWENIS